MPALTEVVGSSARHGLHRHALDDRHRRARGAERSKVEGDREESALATEEQMAARRVLRGEAAPHQHLPLTGVEIEHADVVALHPRTAPHAEDDGPAAGERRRPAVALARLGSRELLWRRAAVGRHTPQTRAGGGRVDHLRAVGPGGAPEILGRREDRRRAARSRDLADLTFIPAPESDPLAVGRVESPPDRRPCPRSLRFRAGRVRGDEAKTGKETERVHQRGAVRRGRQQAIVHVQAQATLRGRKADRVAAHGSLAGTIALRELPADDARQCQRGGERDRCREHAQPAAAGRLRTSDLLCRLLGRRRSVAARYARRRCRAAAAADRARGSAAAALAHAGGIAPGSARQSGSSLSTAASMSATRPRPRTVACPVSASHRHTPNAQMSARLSTALPRACSGAM